VIMGYSSISVRPMRARPCAWISGQDSNVLDCDLMALSVLCSVSWLLWFVQSYVVTEVFLDAGLNGMTGFSLVHFTSLTGHTLYIFWFRAEVVFVLQSNQLSHPEVGGRSSSEMSEHVIT
jgi:hypothetical protein